MGAAASQGERGTFRSGLLHWLTTMECPGPVLPRLFLLLILHWLTTMGHKHVFPLLGEFDLSHPFATAGLLSVLGDGYGILTAEYRLWRGQCGGAASPRLRALLRGEFAPTVLARETSNTCGVTWPTRRPSSSVLGLWQDRQDLRPPGCYLTAVAWKSCVYHGDLSALAGCQSDVSPHISLPTYLIGLDSGGTIAYQIAVPETPASFGACVCGLRFGCLMRLCLCADIYLGGAAASQGERRTFRSGLLHWLTTMECPGPVLP